jgi:hypothetical protein
MERAVRPHQPNNGVDGDGTGEAATGSLSVFAPCLTLCVFFSFSLQSLHATGLGILRLAPPSRRPSKAKHATTRAVSAAAQWPPSPPPYPILPQRPARYLKRPASACVHVTSMPGPTCGDGTRAGVGAEVGLTNVRSPLRPCCVSWLCVCIGSVLCLAVDAGRTGNWAP